MTQSALIVVDLQNEYLASGKLPLSGIDQAVEHAVSVISHARQHLIPVFHIRHEADSTSPIFTAGSSGVEIQKAVAPLSHEAVIVKHHVNAFRDTTLKSQLDASGVTELIVIGAMSHMCIDALVRAAADMGYQVTVLHDACATLDLNFNGVTVPAAHVHATMMAGFVFGYATVKSTKEYLA